VKARRRSSPRVTAEFGFRRFRFPADVIVVAVGWYLRYDLSYRDAEEVLVERGVEVGHVTVYRWVQRFTPLLAGAARFCRHSPGDRWFADETYVKVNGAWRYAYRSTSTGRSSTCWCRPAMTPTRPGGSSCGHWAR
jgi:transposase-like protein